jgi:hypothetical protein
MVRIDISQLGIGQVAREWADGHVRNEGVKGRLIYGWRGIRAERKQLWGMTNFRFLID